jgi:hypothetical protein
VAVSRAQASDSQILVRLHRTQQLLTPLVGHIAPTKIYQVAPTLGRDALPSEPLHVWQQFADRRFGGFLAVPALLFAAGRQGGQIGA